MASTRKLLGLVSVLIFNVACKMFAAMEGNVADTVNNIVFKDIKAVAATPGFKNKYADSRLENVALNGTSLEMNKRDSCNPS